MRTLAIGNSFSQDANAYIHQIAASAGVDWECVNLYIGGCSLERHAQNIRDDSSDYSLEINGEATGRMISIRSALTELGKFDFVTVQQASHFSGMAETYVPYVDEVVAEVRRYQPEAELRVHETWAYEQDFGSEAFLNFYDHDQKKMYDRLRAAYCGTAGRLGLAVIPVGDVVQTLRESWREFDYQNGGRSLNRDGFHLSIPLGRMLAGYVWFRALTGKPVSGADFLPEDTDAETAELLRRLRAFVDGQF